MGFIVVSLVIIAVGVSAFDLWYTLKIKKSIMHTLEKIELEQKKQLFDSVNLTKSSSQISPDSVVGLAKKIKQALIDKLKLSSSLTYPQLLSELDKRGFPADIRDEISSFFNTVMRIEYSNDKSVDTDKIKKDAQDIVKKLGLNLNATL